MRWVIESKQIKIQVGKILSFKSQVGKIKTGQTTGGFTIIFPSLNLKDIFYDFLFL